MCYVLLSQLWLLVPVNEWRPQCPVLRSPARPVAHIRSPLSCRLLVSQRYCLSQKNSAFSLRPQSRTVSALSFSPPARRQASPALGPACWSFWRLGGPRGSLTPNPSLLYFIYLGKKTDLFLTYVLERRYELSNQHRRPYEVICSSLQLS